MNPGSLLASPDADLSIICGIPFAADGRVDGAVLASRLGLPLAPLPRGFLANVLAECKVRRQQAHVNGQVLPVDVLLLPPGAMMTLKKGKLKKVEQSRAWYLAMARTSAAMLASQLVANYRAGRPLPDIDSVRLAGAMLDEDPSAGELKRLPFPPAVVATADKVAVMAYTWRGPVGPGPVVGDDPEWQEPAKPYLVDLDPRLLSASVHPRLLPLLLSRLPVPGAASAPSSSASSSSRLAPGVPGLGPRWMYACLDMGTCARDGGKAGGDYSLLGVGGGSGGDEVPGEPELVSLDQAALDKWLASGVTPRGQGARPPNVRVLSLVNYSHFEPYAVLEGASWPESDAFRFLDNFDLFVGPVGSHQRRSLLERGKAIVVPPGASLDVVVQLDASCPGEHATYACLAVAPLTALTTPTAFASADASNLVAPPPLLARDGLVRAVAARVTARVRDPGAMAAFRLSAEAREFWPAGKLALFAGPTPPRLLARALDTDTGEVAPEAKERVSSIQALAALLEDLCARRTGAMVEAHAIRLLTWSRCIWNQLLVLLGRRSRPRQRGPPGGGGGYPFPTLFMPLFHAPFHLSF